MKQLHQLAQLITTGLQRANQSTHTRIMACGGAVVTYYLIVRLSDLLIASLKGSAGILLLAAAGIGLYQIWPQRHLLKQLTASEEDRWTGYVVILSSLAIYPFCLFAIWAQAIVALVALAGLVCCQWGWGFFQQFPFPSFLIAVGLFPRTTIMVETLWQTLTPPHLLENLMAWAGSWGLKAIGHPAVAEGRFIALSQGAVEVAYGCNGLYMAATMAIAGLVLGLFLKQSGWKIAIMMVIGALLAFVFNIPRIMLMTLAAVYWGKWWFDFWHGSWGGQIFVTILFTIYYYAVMAMVKQRSNKTISRSN